jgi:hypothetical protein
MQAYLVSGAYHGHSVPLQPRCQEGPVRSGQVPPRIFVITEDGASHEYELAHYTGGRENLADADLYYTPPHLTDEQRNVAIAELISTTPPWRTKELPPGTRLSEDDSNPGSRRLS